MNNVDPFAWMTQTLERLPNQWPRAEINALMPWRYKALTASACRLPLSSALAETLPFVFGLSKTYSLRVFWAFKRANKPSGRRREYSRPDFIRPFSILFLRAGIVHVPVSKLMCFHFA